MDNPKCIFLGIGVLIPVWLSETACRRNTVVGESLGLQRNNFHRGMSRFRPKPIDPRALAANIWASFLDGRPSDW